MDIGYNTIDECVNEITTQCRCDSKINKADDRTEQDKEESCAYGRNQVSSHDECAQRNHDRSRIIVQEESVRTDLIKRLGHPI